MDAFVTGDAKRLEALMPPDTTYNSALGKTDVLRLLPRLVSKFQGGVQWRLSQVWQDSEGTFAAVEILGPGRNLVEAWTFGLVVRSGKWLVKDWNRTTR